MGKAAFSTVAEFARAKKLPEQFVREQGFCDRGGGGISMAYFSEDGQDLFQRDRAVPGSRQRFHQPAGVKLVPYGLWHLADGAHQSVLYLCEGESDALTLWHRGLAALGLPGGQSAHCLAAEHLIGFDKLYVAADNDKAGLRMVDALRERLGAIGYEGRVFALTMPPGINDVSDLHVLDPQAFSGKWRTLVAEANTLSITPSQKKQAEPVRDERATSQRSLLLTSFASKQMRPARWLVPEFIPSGAVTTIAGDGGYGKSTLRTKQDKRVQNSKGWKARATGYASTWPTVAQDLPRR